jgi:hypothetical protein
MALLSLASPIDVSYEGVAPVHIAWLGSTVSNIWSRRCDSVVIPVYMARLLSPKSAPHELAWLKMGKSWKKVLTSFISRILIKKTKIEKKIHPNWVGLMCAICVSEAPEPPTAASEEFRDFVAWCEGRKDVIDHPSSPNRTCSRRRATCSQTVRATTRS